MVLICSWSYELLSRLFVLLVTKVSLCLLNIPNEHCETELLSEHESVPDLCTLWHCRDKLFPESSVRNVIYQVMQGLAFMHKNGKVLSFQSNRRFSKILASIL